MPKSKSASRPKKTILLRFSVKSVNPNRDTIMVLEDLSASQTELEAVLAKHKGISAISLRRRGNLPIGLETAVLAILVTVGKDVAQAVLKKAALDAYAWLKKRWTDAQVQKLPSEHAEKGSASIASSRRKRRKGSASS